MTTHNTDALEIFSAELAGDHAEVRRIRAVQSTRRNMSTHDATYKKALTALADEVIPRGRDLVELRDNAAKYPPVYVEAERARLIRVAGAGDGKALDLVRQYADAAMAEARKLRTQADLDRPAVERNNELLERQQLVAAGARAEDLIAQAEAALDADRPQRAAFLYGVAKERGAGFVGDLPTRIDVALDASDKTRAAARAIEEQVQRNLDQFHVARTRTLVAAGIGLREDGTAGRGTTEDVTRASVESKMAAYFAPEEAAAAAGAS